MVLAVLLATMAGAFAVFQAGLNKVIADDLGFTTSLLLNGVFFLVFNAIMFALVLAQPKVFPPEFHVQWALHNFKWWWVVPGFFGFALVTGLAVGVGRIGAVQTIIISIAAQVLASIAWDYFTGDGQVTTMRLVGASVTVVGTVIAIMS